MSLTGNSNEQKIWNFLKNKGLTDYGVAGLMGNLKAESNLNPTNLQNSFEKKLNLTDEAYTKAVDNGTYNNFVKDSAGYGLAQWTYWSRKQNLLDFAKAKKASIGDLEMQLEFLYSEISNYKNVITILKTATSVKEASNAVLLQYERPADQSVTVQNKRAAFGQSFYDTYAKNNVATSVQSQPTVNSTISPLVNKTLLSPNHSGKRTHAIDRITPHCFVGQVTVDRGLEVFTSSQKQASCNYVIAKDGQVGLCVDEANRSWCSSNADNDQRAVTIEVASNTVAPYDFTDAAYNKLVDLCVDICKRNHKTTLLWIPDKATALAYTPKNNEMLLTVHRWFANKSCPGDWMFARMGDLAQKVTQKLGGAATITQKPTSTPVTPSTSTTVNYKVRVTADALNYRKGPGTSYAVNGTITDKGIYTIVEEKNNWGKLKSGAGWICLNYVKRI